MKYVEQGYVIFVTPSKQHVCVWCILNFIIHIIVSIVLIRLTWPSEIVVIAAALSFSALIVLGFYHKQSSYELRVAERGDLRYREKIDVNGKLLANSFSTGWFLWLCFEREFDNETIRLLIWQDAVSDESFRRLSRIIRIKRRMI